MRAGSVIRAGAVFVVVTVIVVGALAGLSTVDSPPRAETDGYPAVGDMLPDRTAATGDIAVPPATETGTVLIDDAHANRFTSDQLRPLIRALSAAGHDVEYADADESLTSQLGEADAFLVIDPSQAYTPQDASAVEQFARTGGRVAVFGEPTRAQLSTSAFGNTVSTEHSRLGTLGSHLGIEFGTEYLYNLADNEGNFKRVFAAGSGDLAPLNRAALYTATTVNASGGHAVLRTTAGTHRSGTSGVGSYPVAVQRDSVLAVGDATLLTSGKHTVADNEQFLGHVVSFLTTGNRTHALRAYPSFVDSAATVAYTDAPLIEPAQTVAATLGDAGATPTIRNGGSVPTDVLVTTYEGLAGVPTDTEIHVGESTVSVDGHTLPRASTSLVRAGGTVADVVFVGPDPSALREITGRNASQLTQNSVSDGLAIVRHSRTPTPPPDEE